MKTDIQVCIETICNFPILYEATDKTPIDLVEESHYHELSKYITVDSIAKHLSKQIELVDIWYQFSLGMRHCPAWRWGHNEANTGWEVVYIDNDGKMAEIFPFDNEVDACATMIRNTIERIRPRIN